jgi:hypothetical protein
MKRVIIGCEFSQIVCAAFLAIGCDAYSCDLLPTEGDPKRHFQCDIFELLEQEKFDLGIFHPPCTFITNAGVRHLHENVTSKNGVRAKIYGEARMKEMVKACEFFNKLANVNIPQIAIENPIPHMYARAYIGHYTQLIQPWQFGETKQKAICLWLKNLPKLVPTNIVGPPPRHKTIEQKRVWCEAHMMPDSKDRWKKRSRFFKGVSAGMAQQWGTI